MKKIFGLLALVFMLPSFAYAQALEGDFEVWGPSVDTLIERPVGWTGSRTGVGKSDSAHSGESAVTVWNWYCHSIGYIVTGTERTPYRDFRRAGIPIDFIPTRLTGYYRYEPGATRKMKGLEDRGDSAAVSVWLRRYNSDRNGHDTISHVLHTFAPTDGWIPFSVDLPLRMSGVEPDSVVVAFYSSNPMGVVHCDAGVSTCSHLSIDQVVLTSTSGVPQDPSSRVSPLSILPNPVPDAGGILRFEAGAGTHHRLLIHDVAGRLVLEREVSGSEVDLSGLQLPSGAYFATIRDDADAAVASGRFIVE